jgi:hypothetical protein
VTTAIDVRKFQIQNRARLQSRGVRSSAEGFRDAGIPAISRVNEPYVREVLNFIDLHQELWNQGLWTGESECGTTHCLAGWAVALTSPQDLADPVIIPKRAAELLGLNARQAAMLFFYEFDPILDREVTFTDLCEMVEAVTGVEFKPSTDLVAADAGGAR